MSGGLKSNLHADSVSVLQPSTRKDIRPQSNSHVGAVGDTQSTCYYQQCSLLLVLGSLFLDLISSSLFVNLSLSLRLQLSLPFQSSATFLVSATLIGNALLSLGFVSFTSLTSLLLLLLLLSFLVSQCHHDNTNTPTRRTTMSQCYHDNADNITMTMTMSQHQQCRRQCVTIDATTMSNCSYLSFFYEDNDITMTTPTMSP